MAELCLTIWESLQGTFPKCYLHVDITECCNVIFGRNVTSSRAVLRLASTVTILATVSSTFETATSDSCRSCCRQVSQAVFSIVLQWSAGAYNIQFSSYPSESFALSGRALSRINLIAYNRGYQRGRIPQVRISGF